MTDSVERVESQVAELAFSTDLQEHLLPQIEQHANNPPSDSDLQEPLLSQNDEYQVGSNLQDDNTPLPSDKDVVIRCCSKSVYLNQNVFLTLLLDACYGASDSLWAGTVFAAYLKKLGHDQNGPVGDIEAVNGLAVLFSALPVGYLADRYGRSKVIKAGGILFILTIILHICAMEWIGTSPDSQTSSTSMILLALIMGLWGICGGVVNGPCQALYADSTPAGDRSKYYLYVMYVYLSASCLGPIISIVLFQTMGDDWDLNSLRTIIYVGLSLELLNAIVMMFFDDNKALDETLPDENEETAPLQPSDEEVIPNSLELAASSSSLCLKERQKWIPYILFVSSMIMAIGSGMTVKFFPLFFKDEVGMTPTQVQLVYLLVPIVMALCSGLGTSIAAWFGRVQTTLLLCFLGVSCLYAMVFFKAYLDCHKFVLVPIYIVRTALMNSPYPLQESILMDFVPKNERARWKSLESIAQFGWCGSAALGGYFSDKWDYSFTFLVTAIIQTCGILVFAILLPLVPRREHEVDSATRA